MSMRRYDTNHYGRETEKDEERYIQEIYNDTKTANKC